jgi:Spy/CpxP family protein refolding chaperone
VKPLLLTLVVLAASGALSAQMGAQAGSPPPQGAGSSAQGAGQPAQGGGRAGRGAAPQDEAGVSPAEIQRMFDSYALMQAQQQLQIRDNQFPQFLTRFKALQDIRRRGLQQHARRLVELRRLLNAPQMDEAAVREQLKAMADDEARTQADVTKAYEAIDQVLDLTQQARFRIFEEMMERRKLELVARARQANRAKH